MTYEDYSRQEEKNSSYFAQCCWGKKEAAVERRKKFQRFIRGDLNMTSMKI